jgi:hypothetical protein
MGYCCTCRDFEFKIFSENIGYAIEPIVQSNYFYLSRSVEDCLSIARTGTQDEKQQLLFELLDDYGWQPAFDDAGNVNGLNYLSEKWCDDHKFFDVFAKYVEKGSYIEMGGEDGASWRMLFDGEHCREIKPVVSWPDCEKIAKEQEAAKANASLDNLLVKPMGTTAFVTWKEIDVLANKWAKSYFGPHVNGTAAREETDCYFAISWLTKDDFEKFSKLFVQYDKEHDFEAESEFCTDGLASVLPDSITREILNEILRPAGMQSIGHISATYDGIFIMENELTADEMYYGKNFVKAEFNLGEKNNLDSRIRAAEAKGSSNSLENSPEPKTLEDKDISRK